MGSKSPKELLLEGCDLLNTGLSDVRFNVVLLGATFGHMAVQAMRSNDTDPTSLTMVVQDAADFYMIWTYTVVLVLRIMGAGLVFNPDAFLRKPWSYLDLIIVLLAWLDNIYRFGNFMFFMVLRAAKMLVDSQYSGLSSARVITTALIAGVGRVTIVFFILLFAMVFFGVLGISLVGNPGDFHNRCAVSVCMQWASDGKCLSESWQAIRPVHVCRQYDDPLAHPAGSCPDSLLFKKSDYNVKTNNVEAASTELAQQTVRSVHRLTQSILSGEG